MQSPQHQSLNQSLTLNPFPNPHQLIQSQPQPQQPQTQPQTQQPQLQSHPIQSQPNPIQSQPQPHPQMTLHSQQNPSIPRILNQSIQSRNSHNNSVLSQGSHGNT